MAQEGSRCGTIHRGPLGRRTSAAAVALLGLFAFALPAAGSGRQAAGSVTIEVHGQGRVTSEPAGIDCPGDCSHTFAGSTTLTLRAAPAAGWATGENAICGERDVCPVPLGNSDHVLEVYFRPRAKLEVWPNGEGTIALSPTPANSRGEPDTTPCAPGNPFLPEICDRYYLPGTTVTATATPAAGSTFHGWSAHACAGTGPCSLTLSRDVSTLVGRFTPLEVRVLPGEYKSGSIVSEPAGIVCPPTCTASFPFGSEVTLVAQPDSASPNWRFGCTPAAASPRRCVLTVTNRPNWVGVTLSEGENAFPPATLSVLFAVTPNGQGSVSGRELDCGSKCEHRYDFGSREELRATPAAGWRFTGWEGACGKEATCALYVGPVTTLAARFTENLAPQLLGVRASGTKAGRKLTVRLAVRHAARAVLRLRREGTATLLAQRTYPLAGGSNTLVLAVPAKTKPGRLRLSIAVSDGLGGGKTYTRVLRVGP